jgi:predicted nucleic acid-binding protein
LPQSAELSGRIYADLEKSGQPIGPADPMIAAIAMAYSGLHQQTVGY